MNFKINEMIEYPKQGILSKEIVKTGKADVTLFCMAKGTEMGKHTSAYQALVQVIEGKGLFTLGKERIEMLPGKVIFMKENAVHSLSAKENTSFILSLWK